MSDPRSSDVSGESSRPPRTIVLCFDGTNQQYASKNTNVVKFFGLLRKDCPDQQVAYYQAGIGTYFAPGVVSPMWAGFASLLDEAFAWYLDVHVMGGYKYLMDSYRPGDRICLFGFSRGAYTARALAGMLYKVGLLPRDNIQQVSFAYKAYKRNDKEGIALAAGFKKTFSQDVKVEFVGVWDTVQSTGVLVSRMLPFTESNTVIRVFRHALSLDERRCRFRPNLYHWPTQARELDEVAQLENAATVKTPSANSAFKQPSKRKSPAPQGLQAEDYGRLSDGAQREGDCNKISSNNTQPATDVVAKEPFPCTDVLEVWFSGCHSDVGGGDVQDDVKVSLPQISLHWMVEQAMQSPCGILFDSDELARIGFKVPPLSAQLPAAGAQTSPDPNNNDRALIEIETTKDTAATCAWVVQDLPNEPEPSTPDPDPYPEHAAAIAPLFDQLKINKFWWILEIIPYSHAWQDANGVWHTKWSIGLGKGRTIPFQNPKFHHTVKERMDYEPLKYKPRAIYDHHEVYI